jgi:hypothetical protein
MMGDATHGDVGCTLEALGSFCGSEAGGIGGLWMDLFFFWLAHFYTNSITRYSKK